MRTIRVDELPSWAMYVVVLWRNQMAAPCSTIEKVVECIAQNGIAFDCEVIRVQGDVLVWPWHTKGGTA